MNSQVLQISCFFFVLIGLEGSPPCSLYGCPQPSISYHHHHRQEHHHFLPAPPGKTPPCAKNGMTYCVDVEHYPQQLITSLVASWQFDYNTLLTSEQEQNPPRPVYGPPNYKTSYPYAGNSYFEQSPPSRYNTVNFTSSYTNKGYPERRYPLGNPNLQGLSSDPGFIYSAIIRPELVPPQVTNYDPGSWWKRHTRSNRKKRQAQQATTLCPTRTEFIMPKAAVNNQGNWKYVVNLDQDKRFTQLVGSETCLQSQCDGICSLPNGYTSRCQQQFVQKRLIALDGTGSNLYTDIFWLPHCCVCQITPNGN